MSRKPRQIPGEKAVKVARQSLQYEIKQRERVLHREGQTKDVKRCSRVQMAIIKALVQMFNSVD